MTDEKSDLEKQIDDFFKDPKSAITEGIIRRVNRKEREELQAEADRIEKERKDAEKKKGWNPFGF